MMSAIWLLVLAGSWPIQEDPSPRFEVRIPDDQLWELADDYSTWLRLLLSSRRHKDFEQSLETAISKFREPYAALFRSVSDKHRFMASVPAHYTPDQGRAHVALERIRLMKLLGGFEEMIADITSE